MKKAIMCVLSSYSEAEAAVKKLEAAGFGTSDISVLFADNKGEAKTAGDNNPVARGTLGQLAEVGSVTIPGIKRLVAAGPIMTALGPMSGVAAGVNSTGIAGALGKFGIPEVEAKRYDGDVRGGKVLVAVHTEKADMAARAEQILQGMRAQHVVAAPQAEMLGGVEPHSRP
jgi:hypothetical protein